MLQSTSAFKIFIRNSLKKRTKIRTKLRTGPSLNNFWSGPDFHIFIGNPDQNPDRTDF